jgi:hypothetical protein
VTWGAAWAAFKGAWRVVSSRPAVAIVAAVIGAIAALEWGNNGATQEPYRAPQTKRAAAAPVVVKELPVQTLQPKPRARKAIAEHFARPDLVQLRPLFTGNEQGFRSEILGEWTIAPAPSGGRALGTIDPETGRVDLSVVTNPEPWLSLRNRWEIAAAYGWNEDGADVVRAEVRWRPVKVRRLELGAVAGWERTDRGRGYLLAEAAWGAR